MRCSEYRFEGSVVGRRFALAIALGVGLIGALAIAARPARAVGLVYVDATSDDEDLDGVFGPLANLSLQTAFSTGFTQDNLWGYRTGFGAENPASPSLARYVWESGGTAAPASAVEDSPEITQTLSGLTPSANYDVYVAYWSTNGGNWALRAGFTSGIYTLFNRTGIEGGTAGTPAGTAIWTMPPTNVGAAIFTEGDRTMFLGRVGAAAANAQGRIPVFINDRPNTNDTNRSWLDGLAFVPAGTAITLSATVARGTGNLTVTNNTGEPIKFTSYQVTSTNVSALRPASWLSIQNNYVGTTPGKLDPDAWTITQPLEPLPTFAPTLSEAESGNVDGATIPVGGSFNLGNVWARSPFENVQVQFTLVGGRTLTVNPTYTGTAVAQGDFDANGSLNLADYVTLRDHMQTSLVGLGLSRIEGYLMGDLSGDNLVNYQDFWLFRQSYVAVNGPAGLAELIASVPEPGSVGLAGAAALGLLGVRRRRAAPGERAISSAMATQSNDHGTRPELRDGGQTIHIKGNASMIRSMCSAVVAGLAMLALGVDARAQTQLVSGWGAETGIAGATITEGAAGAFTTTPPTGNAGPRALLTTPVNFAAVGTAVRLSGTVTLQNAPGNQQFRFGLYNPNGHATGTLAAGAWSGADAGGWLGYMTQIGSGTGNDSLKGRSGAGTDSWLANANSYIVGDGPTNILNPPAGVPYEFSMTLRRTGATTVDTDFTFVGGQVNRSGFFTDSAGASTATPSFTAVGFLLNGNTGSGQFTNIRVETPSMLTLRVNTTTGFVGIANKAPGASFAPNYYEILSAGSALTPTTWMGIDGSAAAATTSWEKAAGSSATVVAETNLLGTLAMPSGAANAALGKLFTPDGVEDLSFRYMAQDGHLRRGLIEYVTGGPSGDFDVDGDADGNDFLAWQRGVGTAFTSQDLQNWRTSYHTATAAGAAVPEPTGLALAASLAWACVAARRRNG